MRSPSSITFAGLAAALLVSGCSVVTSLDGWTFGNEQAVDAGHDAGPMDASPGEDAGPDCASGLTDCGGECVDLDSSPLHCGACANACTVPPNSVPLCSAGGCGFECAAGFADCNGEPSDGCEIEIASDPLNCGGCHNSCLDDLASLSCREGSCRPKLLWARAFGDTGGDRLTGIAIDPDGNVYIIGNFRGIINLGGDDLNSGGSSHAFVASYAASGEHRWSLSVGADLGTEAKAIAFDGSGAAPKVHVTGSFRGTANFGGGSLTSRDMDFFIASFDAATGDHLGSRGWGGDSAEGANGIAVDAAGNLYVTGQYWSSEVDFGGLVWTLPGTELSDIFIASYPPSYASTGRARWAKGIGSTSWNSGNAITVDSSGDVYVTGLFTGEVKFDESASPLTSQGEYDAFIASFTSSGAYNWSLRGELTGSSGRGDDIAVGADGHVYVTGVNVGMTGGFLASYEASGVHRWSHPGGGTGYALAANSIGEIYSSGTFFEMVDLGGGELTTSSGGAFIAAHGAADGAHRASFAIGGPDGRAASFSIAAGAGIVCAGGDFEGRVTVGDETLIAVGNRDAFIACFEP